MTQLSMRVLNFQRVLIGVVIFKKKFFSRAFFLKNNMLQNPCEVVQTGSLKEVPDAVNKSNGKPLIGLRGIMSFHIMLHHFFFYSPLNLNLMGAVSK